MLAEVVLVVLAAQGVVAGAPQRSEPAPDLEHGRVVDALTGEPVSGATVETWTEEIDAVLGGFHRMDEVRSDADGRFAVLVSSHAEKVRVRAPGYSTLSAVRSDLAEPLELFPAPEEPPRLRVLDSRGRPIAGARITTTYSCAHDVPALDVRTDVAGEAHLPSFGLQADLPELRVRAAGYRALEYLDPRPMLAAGGSWTVRLPRAPGIAATLLDREGELVVETPLLLRDAEGDHVVSTDGRGRFVLSAPYATGYLSIEPLLTGGPPAFLTGHWENAVLRLGGEHWPEDLTVGTVMLRTVGGGEVPGLPPARLLHEHGWRQEVSIGEATEFPAGHVRLAFGGAFTGYLQVRQEFELTAGEPQTLELGIVPEPRVTVSLPESAFEAWVEVGADSRDLEGGAPIPVPADGPLVFFARTAEAQHILELSAVEEGLRVDLSGPETCVWQAPTHVLGSMTVTVARELAEGRGEFVLVSPSVALAAVRLPDPGLYRIEGPVGVPFFVRYRCEGFVTTGFAAVLTPDPVERILGPVRVEDPSARVR